MERKGTFASPATAFASSVLPVPGGPTSSTPLGILAPISVNALGSLRKSTTSLSSSFSSSQPRTSSKVFWFLPSDILAVLLPKFIAWRLSLPVARIISIVVPMMIAPRKRYGSTIHIHEVCSTFKM